MGKIIIITLIVASSAQLAKAKSCGAWKNMAINAAKQTSQFLYHDMKECSFKSAFEIYLSHKRSIQFPNKCFENFYRAEMLTQLATISKGCES